MLDTPKLSFTTSVEILKAVAEPTRLRLVVLLSRGDLTVTDLVSILGQSQPRISRHLKLLVESGVLSRYQEGAFAYFRLCDDPMVAGLVSGIASRIERGAAPLARDEERLQTVREARARRASDYFSRNAADWDAIRSLHVPERLVEAALTEALGEGPFGAFLDIGTGTGRLLELLAPACERMVGIDASREMLGVARAKLAAAAIGNAQVRLGDVYRLPVEPASFDLVALHQVLHFLDEPAEAIREAARALKPGGRLAIVDFAPHDLEFLRTEHAHLRLGFSHEAVTGVLEGLGLGVLSVRDLVPDAGGPHGLTVTIWVAEAPARRTPSPAVPKTDAPFLAEEA